MKTKSLCEKGRDLGHYRADAQVDGCLMTWEYLVRFRKRAFILPILYEASGRAVKSPEYPTASSRSPNPCLAPSNLPGFV